MAIQLGLGQIPRPTVLYVGREDGACWYYWDGQKRIPEPLPALTGYLQGLTLRTTDNPRFPDRTKASLEIQADKPYQIRTEAAPGRETTFLKGLLSALDNLDEAQLLEPLTVAVEPGDTETVVLCQLYDPETYQSLRSHWEHELDWQTLLHRVMDKLARLHGRPASLPTPEPKVPFPEPKSSPPEPKPEPLDAKAMMAQSMEELTRLGWTIDQGRECLLKRYGKRSRQELTEGELRDFLLHLQQQP